MKIFSRALISGFIFIFGTVIISISISTSNGVGRHKCDEILEPNLLGCIGRLDTPFYLMFLCGCFCIFLSLLLLFKIYRSSPDLRKRLLSFSKVYLPFGIIAISLGFVPIEICLGFLGCGYIYFWFPISVSTLVIYVVSAHLKILLPTQAHPILKFFLYIVISALIFVVLFWSYI